MSNPYQIIGEKPVREVMTSEVITVRPDTLLEEVGLIASRHGIGGVPVADDGGRLLGIVTDYTLMQLYYQPELRNADVASVMTKHPIAVMGSTPIAQVAEILVRHRINRVPVVEGERVRGIVSREDLVRRLYGVHGQAQLFDPAPQPMDSNHRSSEGAHILIVDDSAVMHAIMRETLQKIGYDLEFSFSGEDALKKIEAIPPDLILLDRLMPGMDGVEMMRQLRGMEQARGIPIILVTACDRPEHVAEALACGAVDFVNKPIAAVDLQARVASALRLSFLQRELQEERLKAVAAAEVKSEFLANMSHEIRTPMTAILGFADILAEKLHGEDREPVEVIRRNGQYLLEIISDILDVSKLEAGKMQLESLPTSIRQVVRDVTDLIRIRAEKQGLGLKVENAPDLPDGILTDPTRLRQILINVLGNAVKFTSEGGITVRTSLVSSTGDEVSIAIAISDTGMGMSPEQLAKLFQPFTQSDRSTTRLFGGTGLGLSISKRLANLLGGDISVTSEQGTGSTFTVTINSQVTSWQPEPQPFERREADKPTKFDAPIRVLLAEDGPDNQRLIRHLLEKAGAQIEVVENGALAVEAATSQGPFDVILMDMHMPVLDGFGATKKLRELGYTRPIIALTANALEGDREKCLTAGCNEYLTKPINRQTLLSQLRQFQDSTASDKVDS